MAVNQHVIKFGYRNSFKKNWWKPPTKGLLSLQLNVQGDSRLLPPKVLYPSTNNGNGIFQPLILAN